MQPSSESLQIGIYAGFVSMLVQDPWLAFAIRAFSEWLDVLILQTLANLR